MMPKDILFIDGVSFNNILNLIDILNDKILEVGQYNYNWDGANSSSGIYIIRLNTSSKTFIKKAILTK